MQNPAYDLHIFIALQNVSASSMGAILLQTAGDLTDDESCPCLSEQRVFRSVVSADFDKA